MGSALQPISMGDLHSTQQQRLAHGLWRSSLILCDTLARLAVFSVFSRGLEDEAGNVAMINE